MKVDERLITIRAAERESHIAMYSDDGMSQTNSWLRNPVKTIRDIMPLFDHYKHLQGLDLGCGPGRNALYVAQRCKRMGISCTLDCVDIIEPAIKKLKQNAKLHGLEDSIRGLAQSIESYEIVPDSCDLVLAVSALEHVIDESAFIQKLMDIKFGLKTSGIVCLIINSDVRETDVRTGNRLEPQFEINLPTSNIQSTLRNIFGECEILKSGVKEQHYDIPRKNGISRLQTSVVTFVARKPNIG